MPTAVGKLGSDLSSAMLPARTSDPKLFAYASAMLECRVAGQAQLSPSFVAEAIGADRVYLNVDEFVRNNPSIAAPITALVAANLFEKLYALKDGAWVRKPELLYPKLPDRAERSHINNWMPLFVGLCRQWLSVGGDVAPLHVISFNYDKVFETVLRERWEQSELRYPAFDSYGAFSHLPIQCVDAAYFLAGEYKNLGFAGSDAPVIKEISEAIIAAERIFSVGFSFAPANVRILGLCSDDFGKFWINMRMRVQNFGGNDVRLTRALEGLFPGIAPSNCDTAGADQLVSNGFFEH